MEKTSNRNQEEIINSQKEQLTRYETRLKGISFYHIENFHFFSNNSI